MRRTLGVLACFMLAGPAHAEWREASSDHFVVYADDSEKDVRRFAENLEHYHAAMEFLTGRKAQVPSPSNRVTIYAVGTTKDVRKLAGGDNKYLGGFYIPRAGGSRAFVPDIKSKGSDPDFSMIILLHEYAHHFLISTSRYAMPRWLSEGSAEFFASASFPRDGGVQIGRPALHRAGELFMANDVSIEELLDQNLYAARKAKGYDAFYGRSWLLYHYLTFSDDRRGQLPEYQRKIATGTDPLQAGKDVFGDLKALEKDLDRYLKSNKMLSFDLKPERFKTGAIEVRTVGAGEAEMLPVMIRSQRGVGSEQAAGVLADARAVALRHPSDAAVLAALAEAEFDAGNDAEAIAAADRAIAADPRVKNAYVQKGYALFRQAEDASDETSAYAAAMAPFQALNKLEADHPLPLIYFYRSFVQRGTEPTDLARHALERASELAPFDQGLLMNVAIMQAEEGKIGIARLSLAPIAANPHGGGLAAAAQSLRDRLEAAPEGSPYRPGPGAEIETADLDVGGTAED